MELKSRRDGEGGRWVAWTQRKERQSRLRSQMLKRSSSKPSTLAQKREKSGRCRRSAEPTPDKIRSQLCIKKGEEMSCRCRVKSCRMHSDGLHGQILDWRLGITRRLKTNKAWMDGVPDRSTENAARPDTNKLLAMGIILRDWRRPLFSLSVSPSPLSQLVPQLTLPQQATLTLDGLSLCATPRQIGTCRRSATHIEMQQFLLVR